MSRHGRYISLAFGSTYIAALASKSRALGDSSQSDRDGLGTVGGVRRLPALAELGALLCDAGGVLLLPDGEILRSLVGPFGLAPSDPEITRAHFVSMSALDRAGHTSYSVGHRAFARAIGSPAVHLDGVANAVAAIYTRHPLVPIPGAAESLERLAEAGVVLGVVSNASGTMADQLAGHQICSVDGGSTEVAVVVDSEVVGIAKPDPAIFQIALDAIDVPRDRCWYIGDSVHFDVQGAASAGLPCVHIDPYDLCEREDHPHVSSLEAFTDAVLV